MEIMMTRTFAVDSPATTGSSYSILLAASETDEDARFEWAHVQRFEGGTFVADTTIKWDGLKSWADVSDELSDMAGCALMTDGNGTEITKTYKGSTEEFVLVPDNESDDGMPNGPHLFREGTWAPFICVTCGDQPYCNYESDEDED